MRITLLTDFGDADGYVGAMKGVIATLAPDTPVTDITHGIPRGDIRHASHVLAQAAPCFPARTVHVVVVDPGVGTDRRAVAIDFDDQTFVAPDNGVLTEVLARANGPVGGVVLSNTAFWRHPVSHTFHGRDIFAPCAAYLTAHVPLSALGSPLDPRTLVRFPLPAPAEAHDGAVGEVIHLDAFGNAVTNITREHLVRLAAGGHRLEVLLGERSLGAVQTTYGSVAEGEPLALIGSTEQLELAVNSGSAAETLGLAPGTRVTVRVR